MTQTISHDLIQSIIGYIPLNDLYGFASISPIFWREIARAGIRVIIYNGLAVNLMRKDMIVVQLSSGKKDILLDCKSYLRSIVSGNNVLRRQIIYGGPFISGLEYSYSKYSDISAAETPELFHLAFGRSNIANYSGSCLHFYRGISGRIDYIDLDSGLTIQLGTKSITIRLDSIKVIFRDLKWIT